MSVNFLSGKWLSALQAGLGTLPFALVLSFHNFFLKHPTPCYCCFHSQDLKGLGDLLLPHLYSELVRTLSCYEGDCCCDPLLKVSVLADRLSLLHPLGSPCPLKISPLEIPPIRGKEPHHLSSNDHSGFRSPPPPPCSSFSPTFALAARFSIWQLWSWLSSLGQLTYYLKCTLSTYFYILLTSYLHPTFILPSSLHFYIL